MRRRLPTTRRRRQRPGYLYVAVMAVSVIVSVTGFAAIHAARLQTLGGTGEIDRQQALRLAASAVELALAEFHTNPTWTTDYAYDTEYPATPIAVNGGTLTWRLVDLGSGSRRVDGIGRQGEATAVVSVRLGTGASGLLDVPLVSNDKLYVDSAFDSLAVLGGPAVSNTEIERWGTINGDTEAPAYFGNGTITGTQTTTGGPSRDLPDSSVFDYYVANGTVLDNGLLDDGNGGLSLSDAVLSPAGNPWGATNPDGIYVIHAQGWNGVSIKNCRIVGTLVVLNLAWSAEVTVAKEINWEPAHPNYPALLVEGDLELVFTNLELSEAGRSTNFNPAGTPWQGTTDNAINDTYPSEIAGIVYCSDDLLFDGGNNGEHPTLTGVVIAGDWIWIEKDVHPTISYDPSFAADPPPGFGTSYADNGILPGSWHRTVSP